MSHFKVLLAEEYHSRERLSMLFLERSLRRAGHEVRLSNSWELERDFREWKPDVVLDNISDSVGHWAGKLGMLGERQRNINLIWEQILCPWNLPRYRLDDDLCERYVDGRVAWGRAFRDVLLAENPRMDPERVRTTGSIKHAVNALFRDVDPASLKSLYPYDFDRYERVILLADSFTTAGLPLEDLRDPAADSRMPYLYEVALYSRRLRTSMIEVTRELARRHPEDLFLVRVHPHKDPHYYADYQRQFDSPNVVINRTGEIGSLLRIADLLIAAKSNTLVDAHYVGTPAIRLIDPDCPFEDVYVLSIALDAFGQPLAAADILEHDLEDLVRFDPSRTSARTVAEAWFGDVSPGSFEKVRGFVEEVAERPALPKNLRWRSLVDPVTLKRVIRNQVRRRGWGIRPGPQAEFDYDALYGILTSGVQ